MADYTITERTTRERIYTLRLPSNATEVSKMLSGVLRDLRGASDVAPMDDAVLVEADEEELRLIVTVSQDGTGVPE